MSEQELIDFAECRGWRAIPDDDYAFEGYAIQKKKRIFGIEYWVDEYLCKDKASAINTLRRVAI